MWQYTVENGIQSNIGIGFSHFPKSRAIGSFFIGGAE